MQDKKSKSNLKLKIKHVVNEYLKRYKSGDQDE